jgi:hypothetical protein
MHVEQLALLLGRVQEVGLAEQEGAEGSYERARLVARALEVAWVLEQLEPGEAGLRVVQVV